ncbi:hypothetical protein AA313_de0203461 [Arthrobotrys entomopaga]|nr:hypothetical protein AA313_de0203461 [Arthrobotrys entomopaga]
MLPKFLKSSYHRYKTDTQSFTSWLVATASSCGATVESDTKDGDTPTIPLRSYKTLVDAVVESQIALPKALESVLERAISIRKQCARVFQFKKPEEKISNAGHWHFITVMEDALNRLKPLNEKEANVQPDSSASQGKDDDYYSQLSNRFALLALDETWKDEAETKVASKKSKKKKNNKKKENAEQKDESKTITRYNIEDEYDEDLPEAFFIAYCLFVDLNNLRDFIKETWTEYKDGTLDAMTAAVTTNSALIVGQNLINETKSFVKPSDFQGADNLPRTFFMVNALLTGRNPEFRQRRTDPFNLEVYSIADWTLGTAMVLLESYIPVIQPKVVSFYRKGNWGVVDSSKPYDKRSTEEKFDNDREAISDFLGECSFLVRAKKNLWVEDEVTKAVREVIMSKKVNMYHAFSTHVLLDVGNILAGKKSAPYDDLRMTVLRAKKNLTSFLEFSSRITCPTWSPTNNTSVRDFLRSIDAEFTKDLSIPLRQKASGPGFPHTDFHIFKENPILSGLVMYDLNLKMQELGTAIINGWGTVLPTLYLYNLLDNSPSVPTVEWHDLDEFLKIHDENSIFVGGKPRNLEDSFMKLQLCLGLSPTALAKGGRNKGLAHSTQGPRPINATTVLSAAFNTALNTNRQNALSVAVVDKVLECLELEPDMTPALVKSPSQATTLQVLKRKWKNKKTLTPLQLLTVMRSNLALEERKLLFNYIGIHERCFEFLGKLRDHVHDKLVQYNGVDYLEAEHQLPFVVSYVMHAAIMSAKASKAMGLNSKQVGSVMLVRTANLMKEYTNTKGNVACKELKVFSKAYKANIEGNCNSEKKNEKELYWTAIEEIVDTRSLALLQMGRI